MKSSYFRFDINYCTAMFSSVENRTWCASVRVDPFGPFEQQNRDCPMVRRGHRLAAAVHRQVQSIFAINRHETFAVNSTSINNLHLAGDLEPLSYFQLLMSSSCTSLNTLLCGAVRSVSVLQGHFMFCLFSSLPEAAVNWNFNRGVRLHRTAKCFSLKTRFDPVLFKTIPLKKLKKNHNCVHLVLYTPHVFISFIKSHFLYMKLQWHFIVE